MTGYIAYLKTGANKQGIAASRFCTGETKETAVAELEALIRPPAPTPTVKPDTTPGVGWLIHRPEWPTKIDPKEQIRVASEQAPMREQAALEWAEAATTAILDPHFEKSDRLLVGSSLNARQYGDLRPSLHLCGKLCPNPLPSVLSLNVAGSY